MGSDKLPEWFRVRHRCKEWSETHTFLSSKGISSVCQEARCPNIPECFSKKRMAFLALGKFCTRNCPFCSVAFSKQPPSVDVKEPMAIAGVVKELGIKHAVVTMVTRDDLPDQGASHIASIINAIRKDNHESTVEVLTSDFSGREDLIKIVVDGSPDVFAHNIETVRRLTPKVRCTATYDRSLDVLKFVVANKKHGKVKSGLMVGLGESEIEVQSTLLELRDVGCDIVTIGQYLKPARGKLPVVGFIHPDQFAIYGTFGMKIGLHMVCGPLVRSSYVSDNDGR